MNSMLDLSGIRNDMEDTKNSEEIEFNFDEQGMQLDDDKTLNTIFENEAIVEHSSSPNSPNQSTPSTSEFRAHIKRRRAKVDRIESVDYETQIPSERLMLLLQNTTRLIVERPLIVSQTRLSESLKIFLKLTYNLRISFMLPQV